MPLYDGIGPDDAIDLRAILEGRQLEPSLAQRLAAKGWIDPSPHGHLLTLAGRCVIDSSTLR
ncbi:hypothetical protein [Pelagibacterium limicola]|uniref:hypothetical protein n=1 Tax=Pelagibacterium limicola TaxID=2791022 RepID=UPI0018AF663F|nr:hypothetical protein [Pelagibacterium limicola]